MGDFATILLVLGAASFAAFMDVLAVFRKRSVGVTGIATHAPTIAFLIGNGAIAAALFAWSVKDPNAQIHAILPDARWQQVVVVALGVPMLLKSRIFSFGEEDRPFGVAYAYDWIKQSVIYSLNGHSSRVRDRLAWELAIRLEGKREAVRVIREAAITLRQVDTDDEQLDALRDEFDRVSNAFSASLYSRQHFQELIIWAMNTAGIRPLYDQVQSSPQLS